ncbi:M23 family metallopeptidase [Cohnella caldifontis]|uniref:M23 family metallopeptidase n=1 Tax=Cohnella caldifontis TaxID=3027471 RepID=UPI0023EC516B|nr:M23 family metallopeptidase [Cohnella sp. YIM B05605]
MSNEGNKTPRKIDESTKSTAGTMPAARSSGWKRLLSKRWVFPAAYMAAAAIIVTILWLNAGGQGKDSEQAIPGQASADVGAGTDATASPEAAPVAATGETLRWPVDKLESYKTTLSFYDASAPEEERQAAMIEHDNTFYPHTAIDLARKDGKDFNVQAALSGKVTVAEQTPTNGFEVHIQHAGGYETVYQSLKDVKVQVGQEVEQGDVIGAAGQSTLESAEGVHVHFEVLSNDQSVNPATLIKDE